MRIEGQPDRGRPAALPDPREAGISATTSRRGPLQVPLLLPDEPHADDEDHAIWETESAVACVFQPR